MWAGSLIGARRCPRCAFVLMRGAIGAFVTRSGRSKARRTALLLQRAPEATTRNVLTALTEQSSRFGRRDVVGSWLGGLLATSALGGIRAWSHDGRVVGSFGASTVLLFGHRPSPLAQPRNIVLPRPAPRAWPARGLTVLAVALMVVGARPRRGGWDGAGPPFWPRS